MTTRTPAAPDYPLIRPDQLGDPARVLYSQLGRPVSRRAAPSCAEDYPELVTELVDAGLGTTDWQGRLEHVAIHTHCTRATGPVDVLVVVRQADLSDPGHRGTLIAAIEGATTRWRTDRTVPELTIRAPRHGHRLLPLHLPAVHRRRRAAAAARGPRRDLPVGRDVAAGTRGLRRADLLIVGGPFPRAADTESRVVVGCCDIDWAQGRGSGVAQPRVGQQVDQA